MVDEPLENGDATALTINRFFTDALGANLRNQRWSWGAIDPMTNRVFLRVWDRDIQEIGGKEYVEVSWKKSTRSKKRPSNGLMERQAHVDQMHSGARGFGVVCVHGGFDSNGISKIASFDQAKLLRLGKIRTWHGVVYARINARVPVAELARRRTAQSTLAQDLTTISNRKIGATQKERLVNARIGQGSFRTDVLKLWGGRCCVTGSETLDAIRASHIKPWRDSADEERLDPNNGLPLTASFDALFDAGLLTFLPTGKLIVSNKLSEAERRKLGICDDSLCKKPTRKTAAYLAYHRAHVFLA